MGQLNGHTKPVSSVAFAPNGRYIVTGSDDCFAIVWNTMLGACMQVLSCGSAVLAVCFAPDSMRVASGSHLGIVKIWNAVTGDLERDLRGHTGAVASLAFFPKSGSRRI